MPNQILDQLERDKEGYLKSPNNWNIEIAKLIAAEENIILSEEHILILNLMREYFFKFEMPPGMRPLVQALKNRYGEAKGSSAYLHKLFPNSPAKQGNKIAGLPKPLRCL